MGPIMPPMGPMPPGLAGTPQAASRRRIWSISGCCAAWIRVARSFTWGVVAWVRAIWDIMMACWWWGIMFWRNTTSAWLCCCWPVAGALRAAGGAVVVAGLVAGVAPPAAGRPPPAAPVARGLGMPVGTL